MKKKVLVLALMVIFVFSMTDFAFAEVSVDSDLILFYGADEATIVVDYTGESYVSASTCNDINTEWGDNVANTSNSKQVQLRIYSTAQSRPGEYSMFLKGTNDGVGSFKFVNITVADDTKLEIDNVKKVDGKVKVTWNSGRGYSPKYNLQYREKNGSWVTAKALTDSTSASLSKLKKGKTYQFRVRVATQSYWWGTQYGPWSDTFTYKVK